MKLLQQDTSRLTEGECHFNNSICRIGDEVWMAYRRENKIDDVYADIWVVCLDEQFQPIKDTNTKIEIPRPHPDTGLFEDPRLFTVGKDIYISFIAATILNGKHCACQGLARVSGGWKVLAVSYPDYGTNINDASVGNGVKEGEKNWTFYGHAGAVRCLYSLEPAEVTELAGNRATFVSRTFCKPNWTWGRLSGSTPLIPFQGALLGMFHSFVKSPTEQRNYFAGWFLFDPKVNRITAISKSPVMKAERNWAKDCRSINQWWKPNAIFPCGLIEHEGQYIVSYGWQDSLPMLAFFDPEEINDSLANTVEMLPIECLRDPSSGIPGGFDFTIGGKRCKTSTWSSAKKWCKNNRVSIEEAEALVCSNLAPQYKGIKWQKK